MDRHHNNYHKEYQTKHKEKINTRRRKLYKTRPQKRKDRINVRRKELYKLNNPWKNKSREEKDEYNKYQRELYKKKSKIHSGGTKMENTNEFDIRVNVDENLSINIKVQKEMNVTDFESIVSRAKALTKASGYANVMGIKKRPYNRSTLRSWTPEREEELKKDWGKMPRQELQEKYERTYGALYNKAFLLGIHKTKTNPSRADAQGNAVWNDEEVKKLRKLDSKGINFVEIAQKLGNKTRRQVFDKIKNMKTTGKW